MKAECSIIHDNILVNYYYIENKIEEQYNELIEKKLGKKEFKHFLKQIKYGSERALYKMKRGLRKYKKEINILG